MFQQDFMLRVANGRLSTLLGEFGVGLDRFFRTVGLHRAGWAIAATNDDLSEQIIDAAVAGANAWIESMPAKPIEYEILALDPEPYPVDDEGAAYAMSFSA